MLSLKTFSCSEFFGSGPFDLGKDWALVVRGCSGHCRMVTTSILSLYSINDRACVRSRFTHMSPGTQNTLGWVPLSINVTGLLILITLGAPSPRWCFLKCLSLQNRNSASWMGWTLGGLQDRPQISCVRKLTSVPLQMTSIRYEPLIQKELLVGENFRIE